MNILFKSVFIMFFALFIFVSNGVAQEALSDSNAAFLNGTFLATIQNADIEDLEYVAEMLESGVADINAERLGRNALMLLANNATDGRISMLKLLLSYGINVNAQDEDGRTALSYHGNYSENEDELSEEQVVLTEAGAQWSDADKEPFDEELSEGPYLISNHSRLRRDLIKIIELPEMITYSNPGKMIRNPGEMIRLMTEGETERYVEALIILLRERRLEETR